MTAPTIREPVPVPDDFDFGATVHSHGWMRLAPFAWDRDRNALERPLRVPGGETVVSLSQPEGRGRPVVARIVAGRGSRGGLDGPGWRVVESAARRMLRLDADLEPFHARCREVGPPFERASELGFGRLLRAPTPFEDLVKILATTNTSWSGTTSMVARLVELAGGSHGAFPTPADVAALGADRVRERARWGYRSEPLVELAEAVASGRLDLERWETWDGSTGELEAEVRELRGFGPYAAAHVLALLGRHDRIGVDTAFRSFVAARHFPDAGERPSDRKMLEVYDAWDRWKGLAYWFELWHHHYGGGDAVTG